LTIFNAQCIHSLCLQLLTRMKFISGEFAGSSSVSTSSDVPVESLTISGLQLFAPPVKKLGFFNDKQAFQISAAAIGYVAHVSVLSYHF
jgi:hypothetical protein